jgi:orotidine-5'-phosphate decarboxylase
MTQYWPFSSLIRHGALRERLIVSLDLGTPAEALRLVDELARVVGMFKVGKPLYLNCGPDFVREIRRRGGEVFLDLKFHDSAPAICKSAIEATRLGVRMFDLYPHGSFEMMDRVRSEVMRVCRSEGLRRPQIIAVAMLASLSRNAHALGAGMGPAPGRTNGQAGSRRRARRRADFTKRDRASARGLRPAFHGNHLGDGP